MAIVQSTKLPGSVKVEVSAPGLEGAALAIATEAVRLRPQIPAWKRTVPAGPGITGLWRPATPVAAAATGDPMALAAASLDAVFTFRQAGNTIQGEVDAAGGGAGPGGGVTGGTIEEGKIDGAAVSFRAGNTSYSGVVKGQAIELLRTTAPRIRLGGPPAAVTGPRPAVGPPPDGSDPSFLTNAGRGAPAQQPLILRRVSQ